MILFLAYSQTLGAEALALKERLEAAGHVVQMPCEPDGKTALEVREWNAILIRQAEAVLALWNGMDDDCPMDVSMGIAHGRPVWVEIIDPNNENWQDSCRAGCMSCTWRLFVNLPGIEEFLEEHGNV